MITARTTRLEPKALLDVSGSERAMWPNSMATKGLTKAWVETAVALTFRSNQPYAPSAMIDPKITK